MIVPATEDQLRRLLSLREIHRELQAAGLRELEAAMDVLSIYQDPYWRNAYCYSHLFEAFLIAEEVADAYRAMHKQRRLVAQWLKADPRGWALLLGHHDEWAERIAQRTHNAPRQGKYA